jgi:hypothetical protein
MYILFGFRTAIVMHFSLFFERRTSFERLVGRFCLLVLRLKWAFIHATFCWKVGVCVYYVFLYIVTLVGHCLVCEVLWRPSKAGRFSHPVFFVLCGVFYCVESKLFISRISMVSFILYNCVLFQHGSLGDLGVYKMFIFNHLYTYAFNSSSADISRCLCECRLYKTCAEIVCEKK